MSGMIRGFQAGSCFLHRATSRGYKARFSGSAISAAGRMGTIVRPHAQRRSAFECSATATQARLLSTAPGSVDDKKDEVNPKGLGGGFMSKESCVVRDGHPVSI